VTHDARTEFKEEFSQLLRSDGINETISTAVKKPRANTMLERVHNAIGEMLRTYDFENTGIDKWNDDLQDPMVGFISAVSFALRAAYQTSIGTSPAALVFGRDMMFFPIKYVPNWKAIKQSRKEQMKQGVTRANAKRHPHKYRQGDLVLIRHDMDGQVYPKMKRPTSGPYPILSIRGSMLAIQRGPYSENINMRRVSPYYARP
jgi:hypothetical protein